MAPDDLSVVQRIMADVFSIPIEQILPDSSPDTIESWDSLQHLNFVLALEQEFSVQFQPEEIEKLTSAAVIVEILQAKPERRRYDS
jgi:acyl carrier protein